jgi:hypothetical protein
MLLFQDSLVNLNHSMVFFLVPFILVVFHEHPVLVMASMVYPFLEQHPFLGKVHTASMVYLSLSIGSALVFFSGLSIGTGSGEFFPV